MTTTDSRYRDSFSTMAHAAMAVAEGLDKGLEKPVMERVMHQYRAARDAWAAEYGGDDK